MFIKILIYTNLIFSVHHNYGESFIKNDDLKIYPYLFLKNESRTNILFWNNYNEKNKHLFLQIKCKNIIKNVYRTKNEFFFDNYYYKNEEYYYNILMFDGNSLKYEFDKNNFIIDFKCDLKNWILIFKWKKLVNNTYISNLEINDNLKKNIGKFNSLNPLIFVDFNQENLNTKFFTNKFNLYHGGINGNDDKEFSKINSFYNSDFKINWMIYRKEQYIELDDRILTTIVNQINKTFTFYINLDIFFTIFNNKINKRIQMKYNLYSIRTEKNTIINLEFSIIILNNKFIFLVKESDSNLIIFSKMLELEKIKNGNLGNKFFILRHFKNNLNKFILGFKKNSVLYNKLIYKQTNKTPIKLNLKSKLSNLKHFIGNYEKHEFNNFFKVLVFLNEYSIFLGTEFNDIKKIDDNYFLKIEEINKNILITNNINLERKFNLSNNIKASNCSTFKCTLCNINDVCLYCYYNYYLDSKNNCILNNDSDKFVNEYSELLNKDNELNEKIKKNYLINYYNDQNSILYLNIYIKSIKLNENSNLILKNDLQSYYNIYFNNENKINNIPLSIQINNKINKLKFEINDNLDYEINIQSYKSKINCNDLENQIFYKNINCSNICSGNGINYYYKPLNYKKGYCIKETQNGYFLDNNKINLKCRDNCSECNYDSLNNEVLCKRCIKGYKLINNNCYFNNEFNCQNNYNLNEIFDNNNKDEIKICNDFCNLCRKKDGFICSINNFGEDFCKMNNIKVIKYNNNFIKSNLKNCDKLLNNKCIKCKNNYFLNKESYCLNCNGNCIKCKDSLKCNKCLQGYFLNNGICLNCSSKFKNCSKCNNIKCIKKEKIKKKKNCFIDNCKKCKEDNICETCNKNYFLNNNKCKSQNINKYYNDYCIKDSIKICKNCLKCKKNKILFNYIQNKNEIIINYNNDLIEIYKNQFFIKILNSRHYIIIFKNNKIIIRIFDNKIINVSIILKKNIIKNLKDGYFHEQIIKMNNVVIYNESKYNKFKNKQLNRLNKIKKYIFPKLNLNNLIIQNTIKYTYNSIDYSRFLIIFLPFIINVNQSILLILLNTNLNKNFINLLNIIKKNNIFWIKNENIFSSNDFKLSYSKIKMKFKNNITIGEMNLFDIEMLIIFILLSIYNILNLIFKNKTFKNKFLIFFYNKWIYLKLFSFTIFQSYLIKFYYKIIFFIEVFFDLNDNYIKIYLLIWIQFYLMMILYFFNYNFNFCKIYKNILFKIKINYNEEIMSKLFVPFKNKNSLNYNLLMNLLDFFIVLIFMQINNFFYQIILLILIILIKLAYLIKLYFKLRKNLILTQIVSILLLFNFYWIIFYNHSNNNNIFSIYMVYQFLFINIWDILRLIFHELFKFLKNKKKKNQSLKKNFRKSSLKAKTFLN